MRLLLRPACLHGPRQPLAVRFAHARAPPSRSGPAWAVSGRARRSGVAQPVPPTLSGSGAEVATARRGLAEVPARSVGGLCGGSGVFFGCRRRRPDPSMCSILGRGSDISAASVPSPCRGGLSRQPVAGRGGGTVTGAVAVYRGARRRGGHGTHVAGRGGGARWRVTRVVLPFPWVGSAIGVILGYQAGIPDRKYHLMYGGRLPSRASTRGDFDDHGSFMPNNATLSGGPGEFHPRAPSDPGVTVSRHRALLVLTARPR
jgi:hypothetical protein